MKVPFFRVDLPDSLIESVVDSLRSGWLTTGPKVHKFEELFAERIGLKHAIAVNSCTAALHLSLEALGVRQGDIVIVPTMTFAATAEVIRYFDATPVFVDMDDNFNIDPVKLEATIKKIRSGQPVAGLQPPYREIRAFFVMHYGGYMCDMTELMRISSEYGIPMIEDAAHTFPSHYRANETEDWKEAGTFGVTGCFSFYANKCITTGEGGMVVVNDDSMAARMREMSLHGMNRDAWNRYQSSGSWYYEIIAPGYKYNMTDIAGAMGLDELSRADLYRSKRTHVATSYNERLGKLDCIQLPPMDERTRQHSWHLYSIRLHLDRLTIDRAEFIEEMNKREIKCSMHWLPLHLMPYYKDRYDYDYGLFPIAERDWKRQVSLPIFSSQSDEEIDAVCVAIEEIANKYSA